MILIITTAEHRYTHQALHKEHALDLSVVSYDQILGKKTPYRATHVFTDLDRLTPALRQEAALLYRKLKRAGIKALNDPALVPGRFGLLRALSRSGINDFDAYRADALDLPRKWPVFLRLEGGHGDPVSGLLNDKAELAEALEQAIEAGAPKADLLIIEYAAEPVRPGIFRKLSVFRVGDRLLGYTCVHDDNWLVKYGRVGFAPDELYEEEYSIVQNSPYSAAVLPAFQQAGIEYGRVDFGLLDGRPQVYEINSNPSLHFGRTAGAHALRYKSNALFARNYLDAMHAIDSELRAPWKSKSAAVIRSAGIIATRVGRAITAKLGSAAGRKRT